MKFVDQCDVKVVAGNGGNGAVAFRREKFVPFGGPSGGDGGNGGDVVFLTDPGLSTLLDLTYAHTLKAPDGQHGMGKDCYGRGGADLICRVPVGTQVFTKDTHELVFDLAEPDAHVVVAKGGRGGRGNMHFATPYDRAPRRSEPGQAGQEREFHLELKVMADVGLLGFPNVGKSTFIRACSRATPKVADYPFTTLVPHLGVVRIDEEASFVLADIPGLIPGAASGAGLGIRFLQHVERTRALLHLITLDFSEGRDPWSDYEALLHELKAFDPALAERPTIVAMSKADLPEVREAYELLRPRFAKRHIDLRLVSAATGEGVRPLLNDLFALVRGAGPSSGELLEKVAEREKSEQIAKDLRRDRAKQKAKKKSLTKKKLWQKSLGAAAKKSAAKKSATKKSAPKRKAGPKKSGKKKKKSAPKKKAGPKKSGKKKR